MFALTAGVGALLVALSALPSDHLEIFRLKAAILSRSTPKLEHAMDNLGVYDKKRFRWDSTGHTGGILRITFRSLAKGFTVTFICDMSKQAPIVTKIIIDDR